MSHAQKYGFWLLFLKPLAQSKTFLCLANIFCVISHPYTWIWLWFSQIFKEKKIPYGENLGFGTKSCVNFQVLLYVGIDINSIDMQQAAKVTVNFVVLKSFFDQCDPI